MSAKTYRDWASQLQGEVDGSGALAKPYRQAANALNALAGAMDAEAPAEAPAEAAHPKAPEEAEAPEAPEAPEGE